MPIIIPIVNLDRRLIRELRAAPLVLLMTIGAGFLAGLAAVWQASQVSRVVAGVFLDHQALAAVLPALWALLAAVFLRVGLGFLSETAALALARRVKDHLRGLLARHILTLGPSAAQAERSGALLHTAVQGIDALDAYFSQFLPQLALAGMLPIAYVLLVLRIDPLSALVLAVTGPLIPLFMFLIGSTGEQLTRRQFGALRQMSAYFLDTLQGLATLKALGRSHDQHRRVAEVSERYRLTTMQVLRLTFLSALVLELLGTLGTALIAVQMGLRLLYGQMAFEQAFFLLMLAPEFYLPLRALGLRFHASMAGISAARQIYAVLNQPVPVTAAGAQPIDLRQPFTITLRDVSYTYPERDQPALDGVSLEIAAGQTVALVGSSGAGKSTLAVLLLRFLDPASGDIRVNGRALETIDLEQWRAQIAWVPQRPHLFSGTLAENIRLADPNASDTALHAALRAANLEALVQELPLGLRTPIGEGALRLSSGQAQRLALARAFLRDAPFVIMDEPTAHMDVESEAALIEASRVLLAGKTALVIAHRRSTVLAADRAIVLENGRVVADGPPLRLLEQEGVFSRLFAAQGGG